MNLPKVQNEQNFNTKSQVLGSFIDLHSWKYRQKWGFQDWKQCLNSSKTNLKSHEYDFSDPHNGQVDQTKRYKLSKFWTKISHLGVIYQPLELKIQPKVFILTPKTSIKLNKQLWKSLEHELFDLQNGTSLTDVSFFFQRFYSIFDWNNTTLFLVTEVFIFLGVDRTAFFCWWQTCLFHYYK